jgi:hypothetical protein
MCYLYQSSWDCMSCFDVAGHYLHRHQCFPWSNQLQLVPHGIHYILNKLKMATLNSKKQNQIYLLFSNDIVHDAFYFFHFFLPESFPPIMPFPFPFLAWWHPCFPLSDDTFL